MSDFAHNQKPPHYSDPSAADDISSLLNTALAVQESFSKINQGLKRIDDINETHLLPRLIEADEVRHHKSLPGPYAKSRSSEIFQALQRIASLS